MDSTANTQIWTSSTIVIVVLLAIISIIATLVIRFLMIKYTNKYSTHEISSKHTAFSAVRNLLDANGMSDVEIKPLTFIQALLYGNHYSSRKHTIYLNSKILDSTSISAVGIAIQKVGLVMQHKENNKLFKITSILSPVILFSPMLIIPLIVVATTLDFLFLLGGTVAIISCTLGLLYFLLTAAYSLVIIPIESRANKLAMELIDKLDYMTDDEKSIVKEIYSMQILSYVLYFVVSLLEIIKCILQLFLTATH